MVFCAPSGTNGLAHLGKQPSQLGSPARPQRRERICVLEGSALTDRRDPRPKGQKLLALEGPPEKDGAAALARLDRKLREQSTLTDPGVSQHDCDVSPSLRRTLQEIAKSPELGVAPEQRQLLRRQAQSFASDREPGRLIGGRRSGRVSVRSESALLQQFLIEVLGLGLGLGAELSLQDRDAHLVRTEGGGTPPLPRIQPHQGTVYGLLQWIEGQQSRCRLDSPFGLASRRLVGEKFRQRLDGHFSQTLAFDDEPLLESGLLEDEAVQEVAAIDRRGAFKCRRSGLAH